MPSLAQRMRKLQTQLLAIRLGSGALVLPKDVKRIHMRFAQYKKGGHMGPRYVIYLIFTQNNANMSRGNSGNTRWSA